MAEVDGTASSPVEVAGLVRQRSSSRRSFGPGLASSDFAPGAGVATAAAGSGISALDRSGPLRCRRLSDSLSLAGPIDPRIWRRSSGGPFGGKIPPCQSTLPASRGPARDRFPSPAPYRRPPGLCRAASRLSGQARPLRRRAARPGQSRREAGRNEHSALQNLRRSLGGERGTPWKALIPIMSSAGSGARRRRDSPYGN
jgi:hypothetical protein